MIMQLRCYMTGAMPTPIQRKEKYMARPSGLLDTTLAVFSYSLDGDKRLCRRKVCNIVVAWNKAFDWWSATNDTRSQAKLSK